MTAPPTHKGEKLPPEPLTAADEPVDVIMEECGWPWWDADDNPHTCPLPIGHDSGVHEGE